MRDLCRAREDAVGMRLRCASNEAFLLHLRRLYPGKTS